MDGRPSVLTERAAALARVLDGIGSLDAAVADAAEAIAGSLAAGGTLLAAGNGGSAAEAQHLTAELVGRLSPDRERGPLAGIALHADTSTMTALANDYGFDRVFARQVEALGRAGDVLVALSTSGASANLVEAVRVANERDMVTVGLLGAGDRELHRTCTHVVAAPASGTQLVQECHLLLVHVLVEQVELVLDSGAVTRAAGAGAAPGARPRPAR